MPQLLETYASYVPALILGGPGLSPQQGIPSLQRLLASVLFADISGSTELAERFAHLGPGGAEELSRLFDLYFTQLINAVTEYGGDVITFAGDALLACWPATDGGAPLATAALRAAQCGLAAQAALRDYEAVQGLRLSLRMGIGAGEVVAVNAGGLDGRWQFLVGGDPLVQVSLAEQQAEAGDVVASPEAWALLQHRCTGAGLPGDCTRLRAVREALEPCGPAAACPLPATAAILRGYIPTAILSRLDAGQLGWLAELRLLSVLFLRVLGLDYHAADALDRVQTMMRTIQTTLRRFEGSIARFAVEDKGTILMAAFGLPPRTHEDDAERAVRTALALRDQLRQLGLASAAGIATGRAFCGSIGSERRRQYALAGRVAHLAARLMQAAGEDIMCSAETFRASRTRLAFRTLPRHAAKGMAIPVAVYRPLVGSVDEKRLPTMVGRQAEREVLTAGIDSLRQGEGGIVLVEGDAGIGKSRLIADALAEAVAAGVTTLVGAGDAIERLTPYYAWRPVFQQLFRLDGEISREAKRANVLQSLQPDPELCRLAPLLNAVLPLDWPENDITAELQGEVRADNTQRLLVGVMQREAHREPHMLVLEDTQWLDSASWALARLVVRRVEPLLLLASARSMEDPVPEGYRHLFEAPGTVRLCLDALSLGDTRSLLQECLGVSALSPELAGLIHDRAEGNPFFSQELAFSMRDLAKIVVAEGVCQLASEEHEADDLALPDSVQGVIASRIDRLDPGQQMILKVGSVIGPVFPFRLLNDIYPVAGGKAGLRDDLAALERKGIVFTLGESAQPTYAFKHMITQEVAYNQMPFAQRRELHRAAAEWYEGNSGEDLTPFFPLLAHHWGNAGSDVKTIEYLEQAGEKALREFASEEAIGFLSQALDAKAEAIDGPQRRGHWELQLGEAYVNCSQYVQGREHLQAGLALLGQASPSTLPAQAVALLGELGRQLLHRLWPARAVGRASGQRETLLAASRAYERLTEVHYFANETLPSLIAAFRTLNLAEAAGTSPELARGYAAVGALLGFIPLHGIAQGYLRRAVEMVEKVDHLPSRTFVSLAAGFYYAGVGDWTNARMHLQDVVDISERLGDVRRRDDGLSNLMYVDYFQGHFRAGAEVAERLCASAEKREDLRARAAGLQGKATCLLHLGRLDDALSCLRTSGELLAEGTEVVDQSQETERYGLMALAHLRRNEYGQALEVAQHLSSLVAGSRPSSYGTLPGYANPAEVYLTLWEAQHPAPELKDLADKACKALQGFAQVFPVGLPRACLWQGLHEWLCGKPAKAAQGWRKSLAEAERLGMLYDQGLAHFEIGRHLDMADPQREAHVSRARKIFADLEAASHLALLEGVGPEPQTEGDAGV